MKQYTYSLPILIGALLILTGCGGGAPETPEVPATGGADPVMLEYEWQTGVTYVQTMDMHQVTRISMGDQQMDQDMRMVFVIRMPVTDGEKPGQKRMEVMYDQVRMTMNMQGQELTYDSADPDAGHPMMAAGMKPLTDARITMVIDSDGGIVEVEGLDSMMADQPPQTRETLKQFLNKDNLAQMTNLWMKRVLPEKPVSEGDSWEVEVDMTLPQMGTLTMAGTYTHEGMETIHGGPAVRVGMDMELSMDLSDVDNPQMQTMAMELNQGRMKGYMLWSLEEKFPVVSEMEQTFTMSMKNPMEDSRIDIPMTQTIRMETTLE